jgi:curved DNA-binding protein CbpA
MDHYAILNLDPKSNLADIKRHLQILLTSSSFKKLALIYPDKNTSPDAAQKFLQISDAYQFLIDPVKKRRYDATLANPSQAIPSIFKTRKQPTQPPPTHPPGKPDPIPDSWYGKGGSTGLFGSKTPAFKAPEEPSSFAYKAPEQPKPFAFTEPFRFKQPERQQPAFYAKSDPIPEEPSPFAYYKASGRSDPIPDSWYGKGGSTGLFGSKNPTFKAPEEPSSFAYKAPEQPNPFAFTEPFRFNAPERPQPANSTPGPSFFDTTPSKCKSIFS